MNKQTKRNKIKINSWVIIRTQLQNGKITEVIEIGKVLKIENHFGNLLQDLEQIKDPVGYLIRTAHDIKKWVRSDRLEKIASPTVLGISKKGILNMEEALNKERREGNIFL